mmetsp:Transcript_23383/g.35146  ORF Transcript_23383/g.35146 Transcript_23383/m.35146 type:complete len:91 (+) Transcript_23383:114-386(+)
MPHDASKLMLKKNDNKLYFITSVIKRSLADINNNWPTDQSHPHTFFFFGINTLSCPHHILRKVLCTGRPHLEPNEHTTTIEVTKSFIKAA